MGHGSWTHLTHPLHNPNERPDLKLLILSSCTGEKKVEHPAALTIDDFRAGPDHVRQRETELSELLTPAEDLYTGQQHLRLMRGINKARQVPGFEVDLKIVSAGYGLVDGSQPLAPYETTFSGMKKKALREWAQHLRVPADVRAALAQPYDLGLVLLGNDYLAACELNEEMSFGGPVVFFCSKAAAPKLPLGNDVHSVVLQNADARRFSCGLVGLKGEVAARLLEGLVDQPERLAKFLIDPNPKIAGLADPANGKTAARSTKRSPRTNADVDQIIRVPDSWWQLPHKNKLRYYIPEWDDLVDPDYDFVNDIHSGGSGDWSNEVYAHQMYKSPNYDGILISKVVAEKSKKKKERINRMGVHRFLRVPRQYPIMGDCGAFGYIGQDVPPYTTDEILDYYTRLDFDLGVSIDHLIVSSTLQQKKHRYQLTIDNAEVFLREHKKRGLQWIPIGAVQGWDPKSYADAARQYVAMGYNYIGLGGLVRSPTKEVLEILDAVHSVVPDHVAIHLFGLARIGAIDRFAKLGVRSVDSASLLRRAWMGTGQNYLTEDGHFYAAIRIPAAEKSFRAKRIVSEGRASLESIQRLEAACIEAMHEFDKGKRSLNDTADILMEYDHLITPDRPDNRHHLEKTLLAAPWKECGCDICRKDGIDVIIFRGNNRNRRRGFHNTYVFYRLLQRALNGEPIEFRSAPDPAEHQAQGNLFHPAKVVGS